MLMDEWKEDQLTTVLAGNFENVDELLEDMRTRPDSQNSWTLIRAILLPLFDACFAEVVSAVVAFHWTFQYFEANAAYK